MKAVRIVGGIVVLAGFAGSIVAAGYYYREYTRTKALLMDQSQVQKAEADALVAKVGALYQLPQGETPTVATVVDKDKLKDQPFLSKAENGDKMLIFTAAAKAILYRPSINKIVDVVPISIGAQNSQTNAQPTTVPNVRIALLNGSAKKGFTTELEAKIKAEIKEGVDIVSKANAKKVYDGPLVIDLTGGHQGLVDRLVSLLGGSVDTNLPVDEVKPDADIVVIGAIATGSAVTK